MRYIVFLFLAIQVPLSAQTAQNLVTWINMDNAICEIKDEFGDPGVVIFPGDTLECVCGATGNGRYFDGEGDDYIWLTGPSIQNVLTTIDFTLSFYFKPNEKSNTSSMPQVLFSKQDGCNQDSSFSIKYIPGGTRLLSVELIENATVTGSLFANLPFSCWHHIAVVRKGPETILYHNGVELKRSSTINGQRVPVSQASSVISIGSSDCPTEGDFRGVIDEIRLYNKSLSRTEIEDLYFFPDNISTGLRFDDTKDTTVFLGSSVQMRLTETCADLFSWSPVNGVDFPDIPEPIMTPDVSTTYILTMEDSICTQTDSIRIIVVDPASIECGDIFLPTAFTPNGDNLNDRYGISNPFSAGEILAFDIYDRWGNIVFSTTDPLEKWDGSYKNTPVNPGVFLYKLQYRCEGVEELLSGSVTVIR